MAETLTCYCLISQPVPPWRLDVVLPHLRTLARDLTQRVSEDSEENQRHPMRVTVLLQLVSSPLASNDRTFQCAGARFEVTPAGGDVAAASGGAGGSGVKRPGVCLQWSGAGHPVRASRNERQRSKAVGYPVLAGSEDDRVERLVKCAVGVYKQLVVASAAEAGWRWRGGFVVGRGGVDSASTSATGTSRVASMHCPPPPLALVSLGLSATVFQPGQPTVTCITAKCDSLPAPLTLMFVLVFSLPGTMHQMSLHFPKTIGVVPGSDNDDDDADDADEDDGDSVVVCTE